MKREFLQSLTMGDAPMPKEMVDAIMAEHGKDITYLLICQHYAFRKTRFA